MRSLRARRARARDVFEVETTGFDKIPKASCRFGAKLVLRFALRSSCLRCIEADKPDVRLFVVHANRVAVDHANVVGSDWLGDGWRCQENQGQR